MSKPQQPETSEAASVKTQQRPKNQPKAQAAANTSIF